MDDVTDVWTHGAREKQTRLLFSYGSNGRQQLRGRIQQSAQVVTRPASLRGYRRFFCGYSDIWRGGFASVQRCEGGMTYGHVVELTDAEFRLMDGFEGGYSLYEVTVNVSPDGSPRQAWTYISDSTTFRQPPSPAYLTAIHVMLREHWNGPIVIDLCRVTAGGILEDIPDSRPWAHPGCSALDLDALIVEVNSRLQTPLIMPRDMRAIVAQLQQLCTPPVSNLRDLCALTRDQLTHVLRLSRANVSAEDFHHAVATISSAEKSLQMPPPPPLYSAADAPSTPSLAAQPLNERLPFFVYGTLCSGFGNWGRLIKPFGLQARPACLSGYVVVDFCDRGYPGMLAASSHLLPPEPPEVGGGDVACREVFGELVDASCLSSEDYAQLLQQLDRLEGFKSPHHPQNLYERIRCSARALPGAGNPHPPTVVVWAYVYSRPLTGTNFRRVVDGNWPALMRSEGKC